PQHAPGMAPVENPAPVLKVDPPTSAQTAEPKVNRQTKSMEVDLTDFNKPPAPADVMPPRRGKSWLDILREKQEAQNSTADLPLTPDEPMGVYVPDPDAPDAYIPPMPVPVAEPAFVPQAPAKPSPVSGMIEVHKVPAVAPGRNSSAPAPIAQPAASKRPVLYPTPPASAASAAPVAGSALEKKVQILEQQLTALTKENVELEAELSFALEQGKQEKVAIESDNWNLEQSTSRYNEAKRQIDRLGQQIQKERAQCKAEKDKLEAMLFDPQVTQEAQLARLAEMEDAVNAAERKLEEQRQIYEGRIKLLESQIGR
ncbi:MAG: hypothetical protein LRY62_02520, partial [Alphaproteobacteria bacterium]|nr:hypothetical protein [Alphaproteobacteria bacterium]